MPGTSGEDVFGDSFDIAADGTAGITQELDAGTTGIIDDAGTTGEAGTMGDAGTTGEIDYEQKYKSLQGIYKSDKEKWTQKETDFLGKIEQYGTAGTAISEEKTKETLSDFKESLTTKQKEELEEYEKDFALVSEMEGMKRERAMEGLKKELKTFRDEVTAQLTPATTSIKNLEKKDIDRSEEEHFSAIKGTHSDYEAHVESGALREWIETKPNYLKKGMVEIYDNGSAEDIVDLLTDFKLENNITEVGTKDVKLDAKRKAITSVNTKRGAIGLQKAAADDFEGAFDEAINT